MSKSKVEVRKLGDIEDLGIIEMGRGNVISKNDILSTPGNYPVYSSSSSNNGEIGRYGKYMFDDERITWSIDGGGKLFYRNNIKYSVTNVCGWLKVLDEKKIISKYLYYLLINQWQKLNFNYSHKAHPSVIRNEYYVPNIEIKVQEEIVKILDSFTNLIDALNEELSLRQKQFEYYREKLLTFDDNVNWDLFDNIGEITDYVANGSFADLKKNVKYLQESNYAILVRTLDLSSNFKNNNFVYIDKNAYDFLEKSKLFGGEIIINNVGAGVGTVFCCPKLERKMSLGPNSVVLKTDYNKFYYYWLSSKQGQDEIFQITSFSALPKFNKTSFKQILFPVIDEKIDADYIVEKLDAFESLISSLKEEIALRQKQYEYYREKLLTFD